jgi:hypothetical protein
MSRKGRKGREEIKLSGLGVPFDTAQGMLGAMIVLFLGDLTWTVMASQTLSTVWIHNVSGRWVQDVQAVPAVQDVCNDLNYLNDWNCTEKKPALDNQPKNRVEGQKES